MELIDFHNIRMDSNLKWGTQKNYFTTKKYVELFLKKKFKKSDNYLSDLNYKFISDFEYFLRKYKPEDYHRPMGNNTVMKHIERLRKIINMAVRMEWIEKDPFSLFKAKFIKKEREFLSADELKAIEQRSFEIERLQQVKDIFVFSCYTGLAYIDVLIVLVVFFLYFINKKSFPDKSKKGMYYSINNLPSIVILASPAYFVCDIYVFKETDLKRPVSNKHLTIYNPY